MLNFFLKTYLTRLYKIAKTENFINDTNNWFVRGGIANIENDSIFSYRASTNLANEYISTRITIN